MYHWSRSKGSNIEPNWLGDDTLNLARGSKEGYNDFVVAEHGLMDAKFVRRPDGIIYGHDEFLYVIHQLMLEDVIKGGWRPGVQMPTGQWKSPYCHVPIHELDERLTPLLPEVVEANGQEVEFTPYQSKSRINLWQFDGTDTSALMFARRFGGEKVRIAIDKGKAVIHIHCGAAREGDFIEHFGPELLKVHRKFDIDNNWEKSK
jgi:hypothetical protein